MNQFQKYKMTKLAGLNPKVLEALLSAAAGATAGGIIGSGSAMLVPTKYDPNNPKFLESEEEDDVYVRDPVGQGLRSALLGALIGGTKPFVEEPMRNWLESLGEKTQ